MSVYNPDRTFGVEIEFKTNHTARSVVRILNQALTDANLEPTAYHVDGRATHEVPTGWKLTEDGSVSGNRRYTEGFELVSPILNGENGKKQLEAVLTAMNKDSKFGVDRDCGIHVHQGIQDLNGEQIGLVFALYSSYQDVFNYLVSPSRRDTSYTRSTKWSDITSGGSDKFKRNSRAAAIQKIKTRMGCCGRNGCRCYARYHAVNPLSIQINNTIEFRQHQGSLDFEKVFNWVLLTQSIIESSKETKTFPKATWLRPNINKKEGNYYRLKGATRYTPKENSDNPMSEVYSKMWKYYNKRIKEFTERDGVTIQSLGSSIV